MEETLNAFLGKFLKGVPVKILWKFREGIFEEISEEFQKYLDLLAEISERSPRGIP